MPSQPPVELELLARLLGPVAVLQLGGGVAVTFREGADPALMQDLGLAQHRRHALALNAAIGRDDDGRGAEVGDRVRDREHILVVDRDHAGEAQTLTIVPGQGDRCGRGQGRAPGQTPDSVGARNAAGNIGAGPAELGEIGMLHALGAEQFDGRCVRVEGLAIAGQEQIIDPPALKRQRSLQGRGAHGHPRHAPEGLGAIADEGHRGGRHGRAIGRHGGGGAGLFGRG